MPARAEGKQNRTGGLTVLAGLVALYLLGRRKEAGSSGDSKQPARAASQDIVKESRRRKGTKYVWILIVLYVGVIAALIYFNSRVHVPVEAPDCPEQATPRDAAPPASGKSPATLTLRKDQSTTIVYNRSLELRERQLEFNVIDPDQVLPASGDLAVAIGPFLRTTGDSELNLHSERKPKPPLITANAKKQNMRVILDLCIDRTGKPKLGDAGTYTGVVSVVDSRASRTDIPITISLAYDAWPLVLALFVLSLGPATAYLWLLRGSFTQGQRPQGQTALNQGESALSLKELGLWIFSRTGLMSIGAGIIAAFIAFSAGYLKNPTWGASITEVTALFGAMFAAFIPAATAVTAARADTAEAPSKPSDNTTS